jgi:uncharacterized protein (TIGR03083 family)
VNARPSVRATRDAYRSAADTLVGVAGQVAAEQWEQPGLGGWTVRELTAHALRALTTVELYLGDGARADRYDIDRPDQYFARMLHGGDPDIHRAVLDRGRAAGAELTDPVPAVAAVVARVLGLVDATDDAAVVRTPAGTMRLIDYLDTRIVELVIHTLDLGRATGIALDLDPAALDIALGVLVRVKPGTLERTLMVLTGREAFAPAFNVLGPD